MKRYIWKTSAGKVITMYEVYGHMFIGRGCHMRALSVWCQNNPKRPLPKRLANMSIV
jgi:hypothetical protein